jgi:ABC-type uncharacterized transport system permease subunit
MLDTVVKIKCSQKESHAYVNYTHLLAFCRIVVDFVIFIPLFRKVNLPNVKSFRSSFREAAHVGGRQIAF